MRDQAKPGFFDYLKNKDVDFIPTGKLRWWLLGLIVLGWAVEQYEALKNGPVLVYILADLRMPSYRCLVPCREISGRLRF